MITARHALFPELSTFLIRCGSLRTGDANLSRRFGDRSKVGSRLSATWICELALFSYIGRSLISEPRSALGACGYMHSVLTDPWPQSSSHFCSCPSGPML